jgi:hypothetical protein
MVHPRTTLGLLLRTGRNGVVSEPLAVESADLSVGELAARA